MPSMRILKLVLCNLIFGVFVSLCPQNPFHQLNSHDIHSSPISLCIAHSIRESFVHFTTLPCLIALAIHASDFHNLHNLEVICSLQNSSVLDCFGHFIRASNFHNLHDCFHRPYLCSSWRHRRTSRSCCFHLIFHFKVCSQCSLLLSSDRSIHLLAGAFTSSIFRCLHSFTSTFLVMNFHALCFM